MIRILLGIILVGAVSTTAPSGESPYLEKCLAEAERHRRDKNWETSRASLERALERDSQHLGALLMLAEVSLEMGDKDRAVYAYHEWMAIAGASKEGSASKGELRKTQKLLDELDPHASDFRALTTSFVEELLDLAAEYTKKERYHSALRMYQQVLSIDPLSKAALSGIEKVRAGGGDALATEDMYAGGDPLAGFDPEWVSKEDSKRADWGKAWKLDKTNYRFRTNAGFLVLQTASIAMEQMNGFYRKFFRYKLDGKPTPKIDVHIFKTRDEYLKLGVGPPAKWSGGHFTGGSVETYIGGASGQESIREMYGTLFHEAAHQFVSLTGKGGVPGWLNEAYASFFEGVSILSNGSVKWNQVAAHRLFPLATRMDRGWMSKYDEGVRDSSGEWATPAKSPTLRQIVEDKYEWGPPWYAPTWGVVYFLYNYRDAVGRPVYRDPLHEYYLSSAAGRGNAVEHFESIVLSGDNSPAKSIDELNEIWRTWILELRDVQLGKQEAAADNLDHARSAIERGEMGLAREFLDEAYEHQRENPDVLWEYAGLLESQSETDHAGSIYREFTRELDLRGVTDDERYDLAIEKQEALDPFQKDYAKIRSRLRAEGMKLANGYRDDGLPRMALEIARRLASQFQIAEALEFYTELARETGISLARWKVAYNEFDLDGWVPSAGYRAYGKTIEADVKSDPTMFVAEGSFFTRELAADVAFDSDFSFEADMRFDEGRSSLMGLCFGRKDTQNTHAVVLHPKGFLDISTKTGGSWIVRDHRSIPKSTGWRKVRIDVVGRELDVYLDGQYIRTMEMPSVDSVRGGFGLITGTGHGFYRDIRLIARGANDPASRIERELALEHVKSDESLRQPGVFAGSPPPELVTGDWIQGGPVTLESLRGRPAVLFFWSLAQEKVIPTTAYYAHLASKYAAYGVQFVMVVDSADDPAQIKRLLSTQSMPRVHVAPDKEWATFNAYNVKPDGWHLPRILLLDVDNTVLWEGDPGFRSGDVWKVNSDPSFLDGPLEGVFKKRHLAKLRSEAGRLAEGREAFKNGELRKALEALNPLADINAGFDDNVKAARDLRDQITLRGELLLRAAAAAAENGRPVQAHTWLEVAASDYEGTSTGDLAESRLKALEKDKVYRNAQKAWRLLDRGVRDAEGGEAAALAKAFEQAAKGGAGILEIEEAIAALKEAEPEGGRALARAWNALAPSPEPPEDQ